MKHRSALTNLMAMSAIIGGAYMGLSMPARNPSQQEREDPRREKTPQDFERMAKAEAKRRRKAGKKNQPSNREG